MDAVLLGQYKTLFTVRLIALFLALAWIANAQNTNCSQNAVASTTSSGAVQIVAPTTFRTVRICAVFMNVVQTGTPANFGLVAGTGTNCGTGQTNATVQWTGVASAVQSYSFVIPSNASWTIPNGNGLCFNLSAASTSAQVQVFYDLY